MASTFLELINILTTPSPVGISFSKEVYVKSIHAGFPLATVNVFEVKLLVTRTVEVLPPPPPEPPVISTGSETGTPSDVKYNKLSSYSKPSTAFDGI